MGLIEKRELFSPYVMPSKAHPGANKKKRAIKNVHVDS